MFEWVAGCLVLQEKAARLPPVEEIRTVLDCSVRGMLSTFSHVSFCWKTLHLSAHKYGKTWLDSSLVLTILIGLGSIFRCSEGVIRHLSSLPCHGNVHLSCFCFLPDLACRICSISSPSWQNMVFPDRCLMLQLLPFHVMN